MKVLVTGARGFLGSHLVPYLIEKRYQVKVLLRPPPLSPQKSSSLANKHINKLQVNKELNFLQLVEIVEGDITDLKSVDFAAQGVEALFHLAGYTGLTVNDMEAKKMMREVNVNGTSNVISVCQKRDLKLVYMSSVVCIGASTRAKVLNEESPYWMDNKGLSYFDTKKEGELRVIEACKKNKLRAIILNPSSVAGAGDMKKKARSLQKKVAKGNLYFYSRGGINVVDVESVVKATQKALHKGRIGERYILGGENLTIKEYFNTIAHCSGVRPPFILVPNILLKMMGFIGSLLCYFRLAFFITKEMALVSTLYHWYDSTKAKKELDFCPKPAKESINNSIRWWKDAKYLGNKRMKKNIGEKKQ